MRTIFITIIKAKTGTLLYYYKIGVRQDTKASGEGKLYRNVSHGEGQR